MMLDFSGDETAYFLSPKGNSVLARKGAQHVYQQVNVDKEECITVLVTVSVAREMSLPLVGLKYEQTPKKLHHQCHRTSLLRMSSIQRCLKTTFLVLLFSSGDETAYFLSPKGNSVLARKGAQHVYQQVNVDKEECITVLVTVSVAREMSLPLVGLKYEQTPQEIASSMP
ncbi:hypothetical protein PR048_026666 [Dryococelus australis]|uniref:Uncharacterized protein n=1 Tax=Dryococelus australis TaxID=614101 RepID=A0ABQ9GM08_9NEOP|nr:hypothetical protein PR048_026666 [Dryococelus australis]